MSMTAHQLTELRDAIGSGPVVASPAPSSDRRISQRIRQHVHAEISEWFGDRAGRAFGVQIQDLSTTGVGIVQSGQLKPGAKYLLEIPRPHRRPLAAVFTVVRCDQSDGGLFHVQLEPDEVLDVAVQASLRRDGTEQSSVGGRFALAFLAAACAAGVAFVYFNFNS